MTREEIIELAEQLFCGSIPSSNGIFVPPLNIEKFFWAAYRMGQKEMRDRASNLCDEIEDKQLADDAYHDNVSISVGAGMCRNAIRNLPIEGK